MLMQSKRSQRPQEFLINPPPTSSALLSLISQHLAHCLSLLVSTSCPEHFFSFMEERDLVKSWSSGLFGTGPWSLLSLNEGTFLIWREDFGVLIKKKNQKEIFGNGEKLKKGEVSGCWR